MQMEGLENPTNGENSAASDDGCNGEFLDPPPHHHGCFPDDVDSNCSTPFVSAPSSPGRGAPNGYFFSAPASPMHFVLSSSPCPCAAVTDGVLNAVGEGLVSGSFEFEFSARFSGAGGAGGAAAGSMISADELFLNGQIRPMNLSSHLQRPQVLAPLLDVEDEDEETGDDYEELSVRGRELKMRNRSLRRRARSMSPLRTSPFQWHDEEEEEEEDSGGQRRGAGKGRDAEPEADPDVNPAVAATPSVSASSSRSSSTSSNRNSKRWIFLKDLLYRSKSEGRGNAKDKFWNAISLSPSKEKTSFFFRDRFKESTKTPLAPPRPAASPTTSEPQKPKQSAQPSGTSSATTSTSKKPSSTSSKPANGVAKRRVPSQSPHERHYTANRAHAEEMRKKTFLPYRQGLLGCLGFSSRSYVAVNGFARNLNPVSSR